MAGINDKYKQRHKPLQEGKGRYHQGYYIPKEHPEKCLSVGNNIYRSGWELKFYEYLDRNPKCLRWCSEPIGIPYKNPVSNFKRCLKNGLNPKDTRFWETNMYYTDIWVEMQNDDGTVRKIFIEIKPYAQTVAPVMPEPGSSAAKFKAYNNACLTYLQNSAKWDAAKKYFEDRGCEFMIITEVTLKKLGLL